MKTFKLAAAFLISAVLSSCGDGDKVYDYENRGKTEGLEFSPSVLELTAEKPDGYFALRYATEDLFLIGFDNSSLPADFILEPKFSPDFCLGSIQTSGECRVNITYSPQTPGSHSGTLVLKFLYPGDRDADKPKDQILKITGVSSAVPETPEAPDNGTTGG